MFARVETILKAAARYDPERMKGLLTSQSQEVRRLRPLVEENRALHSLVTVTAETLDDMAERLSTHNLLGVRRSDLSGKDLDMVKQGLEQIRVGWV